MAGSAIKRGLGERPVALIAVTLLLIVAASVMAEYLRWEPVPVVRCVVFALLALALRRRMAPDGGLSGLERGLLLAFSVLFGSTIVLGHHIVLAGDPYTGLSDESYIAPYALVDLLALALIVLSVHLLATGLYVFVRSRAAAPRPIERGVDARSGTASGLARMVRDDPVGFKMMGVCAVILIALWVPYLLTYWPGLIFGDTVVSMNQMLGTEELANNHPVVFTLSIWGCIELMKAVGLGATEGLALFTSIQLVLMALSFAYAFSWLGARTGLGLKLAIVLALVMGGAPYVATYAVALWKDPLFSCGLMIVTLLLFDIVCLKVPLRRSRLVLFVVALAFMTFFRSNGVYITLLLAVILLVVRLLDARRAKAAGERADRSAVAGVRNAVIASFAIALCYLVISGPGYTALGAVPAPRVEACGVPLAQMARVVVTDGDMSDEDRALMDEMLSIEQYETNYRPCCIDLLKWNPDFNWILVGSKRFFVSWLSMFLRNPVTYFEAWELQTCGFWTVNVDRVNEYATNIASGAPKNFDDALQGGYGVYPANLLGTDAAYDLFPMDEWSVPIGPIFWGILYLGICLFLLGRRGWLVSLVPSVGLVGTLLVASPIWYWPRYGAAVQFLLPFYVFLGLAAAGVFALKTGASASEAEAPAPGKSETAGTASAPTDL